MARGESVFELDQRVVESILEQYVRPVVEKILRKHVISDIYGAYTPKRYAWIGGETYKRRNSLTWESWYVSDVDGDTLYVTTDAPAISLWGGDVEGDGAFLAMLENGDMGAWSRATGESLPRPALSNAQKEVDKSQAVVNAVMRGIKHFYKHN